ncbi:MAG TPA: hypothetical protein DD648_07885, partial [Candidatus Omnitrophica bacterium]|nr:hypothetical protein [Candidatus Omnitrophota bacterium]
AWAQEGSSVPGKLTMGAEFSYLKYEEPDFMEQAGPLFGVYAEYAVRTPENDKVSSLEEFLSSYQNNYVFGLEGQFLGGQVDYESNGTGSLDDINEYLFEIRGLAGYDFPVVEATVLTPYIGIGYRYLDDNMGGKTTTTGHGGYDRESHYVYMPFGLKTKTPLEGPWSLGFNVEYDLFLSGTQESHLEDVSSSLSTLENDQEEGYGVRGSIQLVRQADTWNFLVEPFIRYWNVDESNIAVITCGGTPCAAGYEPNNESTEYGVKVGTRF